MGDVGAAAGFESEVLVRHGSRPQPAPGIAAAVAARAADRAAAGTLTWDGVKEFLRAIDGLVPVTAADDCRSAAQGVVDAARSAGVLGRGALVMQANLHARLGDVDDTARIMGAAHLLDPEGFTDTHALAAWRELGKHGADKAARFVDALQERGVPLSTSDVLGALTRAQTHDELTAAIEELHRNGGLPDVVAAGRAFTVLRKAQGRSAQHVLQLIEVARASSGLSPRVVNDALVVLAELGAADASRGVLETAVAAGLRPTAEHRLAHVQALANGMRFDEALTAYQQYLDDGFPAGGRARRVQVLALGLAERTSTLSEALLDWARAIRDGQLDGDPPASTLTSALSALLGDDVSVAVDVVRGTADVFSYNGTHAELVLRHAGRSRSLPVHARAVAAFATAGLPPTRGTLDLLVELTADQEPADVAAALGLVVEAHPRGLGRLSPVLVSAQLATGNVAAAERTARSSRRRAAVEAVVEAKLAAGDLDGALSVSQVLDDKAAEAGQGGLPEMPHTPAVGARVVRVLAAARGVDAAEKWLLRYSVRSWPEQVWEALAPRGPGWRGAIESVMRRMRGVGRVPTGDLWADWLYSFPRQKRAARVARAREQMAADGVEPTANFYTAAIVGALLPDKVQETTGRTAEEIAWDNARTALHAGEDLLVEAVATLAARRSPQADDGWFTPAQLLEIARAYPLRRRPYAQLDTAVELRLNQETEPAEQFAAFLGAVAAAHARALLPEGVERLRQAARPLRLHRDPELTAALFDASAERPGSAVELVRAELAAGTVSTATAAQAAGRLLAATGDVRPVVDVLDAVGDAALDPDLADEFVSAAVLASSATGEHALARELGAAAEARHVPLTPAAQAGLLSTHRPEEVAVAEQGPVWTTAQLAAYNSLLEHELANHLRATTEDVELLGDVAASLGAAADDVAPGLTRDLDALRDIVRSLRRTRALQQRSLAKIAAAADLERASAGTVLVLSAIESVAEQLGSEAATHGTDIRVLDREACGRMAVRGHATLLQFALHNLVSNAIKAHARRDDGEQRTVDVLATFTESDRDDLAVAPYGWVVLSVRDRGDGVPEDLPDNVANWSIPGQPGQGAGIGLRVTENMIRQSGGQLWIDPSVADGSRFCFRLPSAARRDARAAHRSSREEEIRA
ncbi:sensor histidine kinase [Geodermatophilus sp. SYSU D00815]